ncbi:hypothetical protein TNCV_2758581 [Trichonephila clavipes]|nr:hypothetical protein TNCV_2758581 [Trichonephila clavipes]
MASGILKRADNPLKTMNTLEDLRRHGTRKMLRWCLNVLEKIVVKHLHKSLKVHTSQRRRLRESIRRKRPQLRQSVTTGIFCMTMPSTSIPIGKRVSSSPKLIPTSFHIPYSPHWVHLHVPIIGKITRTSIYRDVVLCHPMK